MSSVATVPQTIIEVDDTLLGQDDALTLVGVRVQQRLSMPCLCELTFVDNTEVLNGGMLFTVGSKLRVAVQGLGADLFAGQITAVEYVYGAAQERELRVRGYDVLHCLRLRQPVRSHVQVTVADLARELVAELGVTVEASETGPLWHRVTQYSQSDLELLIELAERCGLYLILRDSTLYLLTLEGTGEPIPLKMGHDLLEAQFEVNAAPACRAVSSLGWDPWRSRPHEGKATRARVGRRIAAEAPPDKLGGTGEYTLVDKPVQDDSQADALAQARLDRCGAHEVTLWGVAEGNPALQPGTIVKIQGVAGPVAGKYVLTTVNHTIDLQKGFVSEISSVPPPTHTAPHGSVVTLGLVTKNNDPDGLGRVQVSLPAYSNVETGWLEVLAPAAGQKKGLVMIPEIGDRVLVLLAHGDPAQGVILGGLFGEDGPPESDLHKDGQCYTLMTPGGHRVRLDDAGKVLRLEDSQGSYIELSPKRVRLHAGTSFEIDAPGQSVVIRAQSVDFRRA